MSVLARRLWRPALLGQRIAPLRFTATSSFIGFEQNGAWDGLSMIEYDSTGTMRIDFATPMAGVGAFMNWARDRWLAGRSKAAGDRCM